MSKKNQHETAPAHDSHEASALRREREKKLTAALYASLPGVVDYVRAHGRLPKDDEPKPWLAIGLRVLIERRGVDIELTERERLVHEAMGESAPYGSAILIPPG